MFHFNLGELNSSSTASPFKDRAAQDAPARKPFEEAKDLDQPEVTHASPLEQRRGSEQRWPRGEESMGGMRLQRRTNVSSALEQKAQTQ